MQIFDLIVSFYHLALRAISLALTDPEFEADWAKFEQELASFGVELPGSSPAPAPPMPTDQSVARSPVAQAVRRPPVETVITNPDGSLSLAES